MFMGPVEFKASGPVTKVDQFEADRKGGDDRYSVTITTGSGLRKFKPENPDVLSLLAVGDFVIVSGIIQPWKTQDGKSGDSWIIQSVTKLQATFKEVPAAKSA